MIDYNEQTRSEVSLSLEINMAVIQVHPTMLLYT